MKTASALHQVRHAKRHGHCHHRLFGECGAQRGPGVPEAGPYWLRRGGPYSHARATAEAAANGKPLTRETVDAFAGAVLEDIHPRDSWRASKDFRQHIAVVMAQRALTQSIRLAGGDIHE